jgi:hypothetical protein
VVDAGAPDRPRDRAALVRGCGREPGAELRAPRLDLDAAARLGIHQHEQAHGGELQLPRVDHLDGEDVVEGGETTKGTLPVARLEEVGHHDDEAAAARHPAEGVHRGGEVGGRRTCLERVGRPVRRQLVQSRQQRCPARPGRAGDGAGGGGEHRPEPVPLPGRQEADGGGGEQGEVALLAVGGAEVEARRAVDEQPRLELPVDDGLSHVRHGRARGQVPIHAPHVVPGPVDAPVARLAPGSGHEPLEVPLEEPVEPAGHEQLELAQHRVGAGRRRERRRARGHAVSSAGSCVIRS